MRAHGTLPASGAASLFPQPLLSSASSVPLRSFCSVLFLPSMFFLPIVCFRATALCSFNIKRFPTFSRMLTDVNLCLFLLL